jgi:hypothetical protein
MTDPTFSLYRIAAPFAWVVSATLLMAGWVAHATSHSETGQMLAYSAAWSSAVAAALHVRCWVGRVCTMIRVCTDSIQRDLPTADKLRALH